MEPMANIALRAAHGAGNIIMQAFNEFGALNVRKKSATDFVTEIDQAAEKCIITALKRAYPDHGFFAEESGEQSGKNEGENYIWIIDPLDGTTNFIHGVPHFAVSIACAINGEIEHAVVHDPVRQEDFVASRGRGASLNGRRIRVSKQISLDGALIGTGLPFHPDQLDQVCNYFDMLKSFIGDTAGIRRAGAAALDLAYVASGRLDAFWEFGLKEWDMAAGALLIKEAGGFVSDLRGGDQYLKRHQIVCGNPKCFRAVLTRIQPFLSEKMKQGTN